MKLSQAEVQKIIQYFTGKPVKRAYIFGSYSRDEANNDSDLDILVELDYSQHIGLKFISMQEELTKALNKKVDLVSSNALSKHIQAFINRDKQLIYER
jgi:uncharacterized protein